MEGVALAPEKTQGRRRRLLFALRAGLTVAVLTVLIVRVRLGDMAAALGEVRASFLILAGALIGPNLGLQIYKWLYLVRLIKPHVRIKEIACSVLAGLSLGLITPGRVGELGRIFYVGGQSRRALAGLMLMDRAYTMVLNVGVGAVAFTALMGGQGLPLVIPLGLGGVYLAITPHRSVRIARAMLSRLPFSGALTPLLHGLQSMDRRKGIALLGLSLLFYLTHTVQLYLLLRAFGPLSWQAGAVVLPSIVFVRSVLPIAIGDLGIRESAAVLLLSKFGISPAVAIDAVLLLFGMNVVLPGLFGALWVHRLRR